MKDELSERRARKELDAAFNKAVGATKSSGIPSQGEYERRELQEATAKLMAVEKAPLSERKEAQARFLQAMKNPKLVAERVGWLLDGSYGYGSMMKAKQVLNSPRMNRSAALTHMIAAFEWQCPGRMAVDAWKKLTTAEKAALDKAVKKEIEDAEGEEG